MVTKRSRPRAESDGAGRPAVSALPFTTVDIAAFAVRDERLHVLLAQRPEAGGEPFPGRWALPGGCIDVARDADLPACARRLLREAAGADGAYLEQLGSWGGATRDPRGWSAAHVYVALVPGAAPPPGDGSTVRWFDADRPPARPGLAFDHAEILRAALERLRSKAEYTSLPAFLLDEPFTLPQLQRTYEAVLGRAVDKSGFRTRMLGAGVLAEAGGVSGEAGRPAMGWRLADRGAPALFPRTFSPRGEKERG